MESLSLLTNQPVMKFVVIFSICISCLCGAIHGQTPKDSMLLVSSHSHDANTRMRAYRDLADLHYKTPKERFYLTKLQAEAQLCRNKEYLFGSLRDLALIYIERNNADSTIYYIDQLKAAGTEEEIESWLTFVMMFRYDVASSSGAEGELIREEMEKNSREKLNSKNLFNRIEQSYNTGNSLLSHGKAREALPKLQNAADLAAQLSPEVGYKYHVAALRLLARAYALLGEEEHRKDIRSQHGVRAVKITEKIIGLHDAYYAIYCRVKRPFFNIQSAQMQCYAFILANNYVLSEAQVQEYVNKIERMYKKTENKSDSYSYYQAMNNYHLSRRDYKNALITNDSLIKYAWELGVYNVPYLTEINSRIYAAMGNYEDAYHTLRESYHVKDSLNLYKAQTEINELQVKYDVNRLNYEKAELSARNKLIFMVLLSCVLFVVIVLCAYLFFNLRRERRLKTQLEKLSEKAKESDKIKIAFINSICHEIRTPLNAIVGFSDLIASGEAEDEREELSEIVHKNAAMLISMIDSMLEVSNLDVSDELLPCTSLDVNSICRKVQNRSSEQAGGRKIAYDLDLSVDNPIVSTNERYLTLILENILDNAQKFTQEGRITLRCRVENQKLCISVTDTGCGIPADKRDEVFGRFVKLSAYTPGGGLGLYLCRIIVTRLGGVIFIDPNYAGGTRMVVELPV